MSDFVLTSQTVGDLLARNAGRRGGREAAVFSPSGPRWTWAELQERAENAARGLLALGIRRGDHVAVWGTNRPEWLLTQYAAAMIGAPLVTINPEWKANEVEYALRQSDARLLVMFRGHDKSSGGKTHRYDYPGILKEVLPGIERAAAGRLNSEKLPRLEWVILVDDETVPGFQPWSRLIAAGGAVPRESVEDARRAVTQDDVLLIQYTSGTTGFPKGAMLTHNGVVNNARASVHTLDVDENDRVCVTVPYYHCFGSCIVNIGALAAGAVTVVPSEHFDAGRTLAAVAAEQCTVLHGVPTMFISELEHPEFESHDLSSLRTGIMAGAPCPSDLMHDVVTRMGMTDITIGYGLTEASPLTHQTRPGDPLGKRIHTVGKALAGTEARVVDPTTRETLRLGEVGEVWVRGYNVMKSYYRRPDETAEAICDGWLRTGDLAEVDADGYFRIVGRLKEMIIVGGHNVYPAEVEQTIRELLEDRVANVQVVGLPHPRLQEVVAVVIRPRDGHGLTEEEVKLLCRGAMEWPKVPRHVAFVDDFSGVMTVTGKIQKFKLREILLKSLEPVG